MQDCINLNTKLQTKTKKDFKSDFYQLMNNAVFGRP